MPLQCDLGRSALESPGQDANIPCPERSIPRETQGKVLAVLAKFGKAVSQQPPHLPRDSADPEENLHTGLVDTSHLPTRFLACRDKCAINSLSGLASFLRRSNGNELSIEQQVVDDF